MNVKLVPTGTLVLVGGQEEGGNAREVTLRRIGVVFWSFQMNVVLLGECFHRGDRCGNLNVRVDEEVIHLTGRLIKQNLSGS